jgi:hypothetical protein
VIRYFKNSSRTVLFISLITIIVSIWAIFSEQEQNIRIAGLVFQLFGIGTVIWGIWDTQESFGLPLFRTKCKHLCKSLITKTKSLFGTERIWQEYEGCFNASSALHAYGPHEKYSPMAYEDGTTHTLESLAESLKENINSIQERISHTQKEVNSRFEMIDVDLKHEEQSRNKEDIEIRKMLIATSTGGFDISICGVILLFAGVILSTVPNEIICLFFSKEDIVTRPIIILIPGINYHIT